MSQVTGIDSSQDTWEYPFVGDKARANEQAVLQGFELPAHARRQAAFDERQALGLLKQTAAQQVVLVDKKNKEPVTYAKSLQELRFLIRVLMYFSQEEIDVYQEVLHTYQTSVSLKDLSLPRGDPLQETASQRAETVEHDLKLAKQKPQFLEDLFISDILGKPNPFVISTIENLLQSSSVYCATSYLREHTQLRRCVYSFLFYAGKRLYNEEFQNQLAGIEGMLTRIDERLKLLKRTLQKCKVLFL